MPEVIAVRTRALRDFVREHAENRPGVYRMYGPSGELLYIGKSIQVRTRLLSYFRAKRGEKAAEIVGSAHRIDWEYTPSEFGALLAELRTIKRAMPVFNVEHKRDRVHCFVKLTAEAAPRLAVANTVAGDGGLYFGPYAGRLRVRDAVRQVSDLLELRDCAPSMRMRFADQLELFAEQLDVFARDLQPRCMRGELGRCLAPCAGRCTERQYMDRVEAARQVLEGNADLPLSILENRMVAAAARLQFEYAAELRDRAEGLREVLDEMVALRGSIESLTFVYAVEGHDGDDRWYVLRRGTVRAEMKAPHRKRDRESAIARARAILTRPETTTAQITPHEVAEILLIARWFRLNPEEKERTFAV